MSDNLTKVRRKPMRYSKSVHRRFIAGVALIFISALMALFAIMFEMNGLTNVGAGLLLISLLVLNEWHFMASREKEDQTNSGENNGES